MLLTIKGGLRGEQPRDVMRRSTIVAMISFLTLIDLFGSQALLPQLIEAFNTDPGTMGFAVNASTFGMAISGLTVAWFANRIDRRRGIWISLSLLSIPTFLLGVVDSVTVFLILRVLQGMCMAAASTLTMTYLSEQCDIIAARGAIAAYITGNVASNLFGRLLAVYAADVFGLSGSFWLFAALNLIGAALAILLIGGKDTYDHAQVGTPLDAWRRHLADQRLRVAFVMGFGILFVFIGVFTYINLHLVTDFGLSPSQLGLVYLVFLPAIFTTPMTAKAVAKWGPGRVFRWAAVVTLAGVVLTATPFLGPVLMGLAVIGMGTFFLQAAATGYVGSAAAKDHAAANGLYLTSYYVGGLFGAFLLGQVYDAGGWIAVAGIVGVAVLAFIPAAGALSVSTNADR